MKNSREPRGPRSLSEQLADVIPLAGKRKPGGAAPAGGKGPGATIHAVPFGPRKPMKRNGWRP